MPSSRRLQSLPDQAESQVWGSYNYLKRPLRRSPFEHGGVGFNPLGRAGLVRGPGGRAQGVPTHDERYAPMHNRAPGGYKP